MRRSAMKSSTGTEISQRQVWHIDQVLGALVGQDVRVAADSFCPAPKNGTAPRHFVSPRELVLADNTSARGLPLYFEGKLKRFRREIGVVHVELEPPASTTESVEGSTCFRGGIAVILRGPAIVRLAFPFRVEKLPRGADNYWEDIRLPRAQFKLAL